MRLVLLLLLLFTAPAGALTISIDSVSLGTTNTADSANNVSAAQVLTASDSVPDVTGGPFAEVDARWAGGVFADDASASATANWQITFTVTANPGVVYNLVILQELTGAFSFVDDSLAARPAASASSPARSVACPTRCSPCRSVSTVRRRAPPQRACRSSAAGSSSSMR
jgi:hypothetical protein